ncbi:hypothetical protein [Leptolyngbya sp. NIES-2104]|uniref:hypothetical protein n=1 Tax=Leptolyngbya sp. NIES-2104 TaxID=1552121 RepID=UPI0012E394E5|nr:hypothetical protein [Leptolyngbya sp. NIES-2104]
MSSINRVSRYDVQFRYLIGKDLVQASVNCDSSLVTPNIGKPFVPDMTGATREMIKLACGEKEKPNSANYEQGYGHGSRVSAPAERGLDLRGFWVSDRAIYATHALLNTFNHPLAYRYDASKIADDIAFYCYSRSRGITDQQFVEIMTGEVIKADGPGSVKGAVIQYQVATRAIAKSYVCPQFKD